jgi:adenylate cyclase class IV
LAKKVQTIFGYLVQHCDKYPEFQKKVLKAMNKEVLKRNADPNNYAYLYDRVKVNAGEKQMFGTQVTYETETTGRAIPKIGLVDSANVDKLRKEYTLQPLKDYLNMMTTAHYEMNKGHYQKMGIARPNLY